jgi:hypothetical protein
VHHTQTYTTINSSAANPIHAMPCHAPPTSKKHNANRISSETPTRKLTRSFNSAILPYVQAPSPQNGSSILFAPRRAPGHDCRAAPSHLRQPKSSGFKAPPPAPCWLHDLAPPRRGKTHVPCRRECDVTDVRVKCCAYDSGVHVDCETHRAMRAGRG